jgi:hypothetical protein
MRPWLALAQLLLLALPAQALPPQGAWYGPGSVTWTEGSVEPLCTVAAPVAVTVVLALAEVQGAWSVAMQYASPFPPCVSSTYVCSAVGDPFADHARLVCQGVVIYGSLFLEALPSGMLGVHWVFGEDAERLDATLAGA